MMNDGLVGLLIGGLTGTIVGSMIGIFTDLSYRQKLIVGSVISMMISPLLTTLVLHLAR